jgi:citrate synthase
MAKETLTITDDRTGKTYELTIEHAAIRTLDLRQIRMGPDDFGLMGYDPAFMNTAACKSRITEIDGDRGILRYRGYPIEQLAEKVGFLEVAWLLLEGELPDREQLARLRREVLAGAALPPRLQDLFRGFQPDAHPMGMMVSGLGALSTFHPEAKEVLDPAARRRSIVRLLGEVSTMAAWAYRLGAGMPLPRPDEDLSFAGNFLAMTKRVGDARHRPDPVLEHALDVLFVLHADHEQNCSTSAMRGIGSSHADPYSATAGACAALSGPLHGGANEAVVRMLGQIGSPERVPAFVREVKSGHGEKRLMGFGHRVYKNYDPRARIVKRMADEVLAITGRSRLLDVALELERIALQDEYFILRKLYPNVDFYSGLIYQALGFPTGMFPVLFAVARTAGWLAQWDEMMRDPEQKIARPRQLYIGPAKRDVPIP